MKQAVKRGMIGDMDETAKCSRCHEEKPVGQFYGDPRYKSGHRGICKLCNNSKPKRREQMMASPELTARVGALLGLEEQPAGMVKLAESPQGEQTGPTVSRRKRQGLGKEIAPRKSDINFISSSYTKLSYNVDYLLRSKRGGKGYEHWYGIFDEAIDKDEHLTATIAQRKSAVLSRPRKINAADESPEARYAAEVIKRALENISEVEGDAGFERDLAEALDAVLYGFSVGELVWEDVDLTFQDPRTEKGSAITRPFFLPTKILSRAPGRFLFNEDGELLLRTMEKPLGIDLPPYKFMLFRPYTRNEDPYGYPALRVVWWGAWAKREVRKFWLKFCERFGDPTVVATATRELMPAEEDEVKAALDNMQHETGMLMPFGVEIAFREAQRYGTVSTYGQLIDFCNREISKAMLGQTMTTEAPQQGTKNLGNVHADVAYAITIQDAKALEALVNGTLIPWIMEFNLKGYPRPRFVIDTAPPRDLSYEAKIDQALSDMGFDLSIKDMSARYNRKMSSDPSDSIQELKLQRETQAAWKAYPGQSDNYIPPPGAKISTGRGVPRIPQNVPGKPQSAPTPAPTPQEKKPPAPK